MRLLGALLLPAASVLAVCISLGEKRERLRCLRDVCDALKLLRGELASCPAAFSDMIHRLAPSLSGAGRDLFLMFYEWLPRLGDLSLAQIWGQAVEKTCAPLQEEEKQRLLSLGQVLGRYELSVQLRELGACITVLESRECEAARLFPAQRRLQMGLALSSGAILAILLL